MADPLTLAIVAGGVTAASSLAGTAQQRGIAKLQEAEMKTQAGVVSAEAAAAENAQRRDARRILAESRASGAQHGLLESGSFRDAYSQSAAEAELDALNIRYQGAQRRRGLLADAAITRASRPSWGLGLLGAGASALSAGASMYGAAGGSSPKPGKT